MKFAAYTEEGIWGIAATEAEARTLGEQAMHDLEASPEELAQMHVVPIADALVAALTTMDNGGPEVSFDLENGVLVVSDASEEDEAA